MNRFNPKPGVYCIPNAPGQHGDLWVEVEPDRTIRVMGPAGVYWRDRTFTPDEFREAVLEVIEHDGTAST